jgi:hypothetical protein
MTLHHTCTTSPKTLHHTCTTSKKGGVCPVPPYTPL